PLSLSQIVKETSNTVDLPNKICASVGTIMDNTRLTEVPKLTIAALCFTHAAKEHILKTGGEALTLDQLALQAVLTPFCSTARRLPRSSGPGKNKKPYTILKGRK
ncbi:hypothetical protein DFH08DRAFT_639626, partial [Mycena albidolilacea]